MAQGKEGAQGLKEWAACCDAVPPSHLAMMVNLGMPVRLEFCQEQALAPPQ